MIKMRLTLASVDRRNVAWDPGPGDSSLVRTFSVAWCTNVPSRSPGHRRGSAVAIQNTQTNGPGGSKLILYIFSLIQASTGTKYFSLRKKKHKNELC